jgi:hypothetical protein
MKVIEYGPGLFRQVKCPDCGSILEYNTRTDVSSFTTDEFFGCHTIYQEYITCPICGEEIVIARVQND